jgi:Deacetylase PdaC/Protein of unknown function (DUF3298)
MINRKSVVSTLLCSSLMVGALAVPALATAPVPPAATGTQQASGVVFTPKSTNASAKEYEAKITIPVISGLADKTFEAQLNAELQKFAADALKNTQVQSKGEAETAQKGGWELRPHVLDISYEVYSTGKLLSFGIKTYEYTGGAHGMTVVNYYNIANLVKAENLQLSTMFQPGFDYKNVLNNLIKLQMAEEVKQTGQESPYSFEGISENQDFSIKDGNLTIHFGQYEIAPYAVGMPSFTFAPRRYQNLLKPEVRALLQ